MTETMPEPDPLLAEAMSAHQAGRVDEAREIYERILGLRPRDADALNFLGMLEYTQGHGPRAAELLQESVSSAPQNVHAWVNLGNVLAGLERDEEALQAYRQATEVAPEHWPGWFNQGVLLRRLRRYDEAIRCLTTAISLKPNHDRAYAGLGRLLYRQGQLGELAELAADWLRHNPENPAARHMLAAVTGENVPDRASTAYVAAAFDAFADSFDDNLRELDYCAPRLLSEALGRQRPAHGGLDILDAGAGTGLCGPLLRPHAGRLVGVDLSAGMLAKARERGCYDELESGELVEFMRGLPAAFDVVLSADTLVYFGALEEVVTAAWSTLRPGGRLLFTVERWPGAAPGDRFRIRPHGRYQHAPAYLRSVLVASGFEVLELAEVVLRKELGADVEGLAVVAGKAGPEP